MVLKLLNLFVSIYLLLALSFFGWLNWDNYSKFWDTQMEQVKAMKRDNEEFARLEKMLRELNDRQEELHKQVYKKK